MPMPAIQPSTIQPPNHPLVSGHPPRWAVGWGQDRQGVFADLRFAADIVQRFRWIPPGKFVMGSPEDEPGRYDDEGPTHRVSIRRGVWLADTPCRQSIWQQVMGENPSRFQHPDRPVEQVSWRNCQDFCHRVTELVGPKWAARLPTEAEWEYSCRAGSGTAVYSGPMQLVGVNNAPALDPIAWYGGNSGQDFDLDDGEDSSDWEGKQYDHKVAGTRIVALKRPNRWGLYDSLGNVWEWCHDGWRDYDSSNQEDPVGPLEDGARRVLRGGGWLGNARYVRAAYRFA